MQNKLVLLARPEIVAMQAYSSARSLQNKAKIYLDANENPYTKDAELQLNRYPEPQPQLLINLFEKIYQLAAENILITRGSDEGIDLLIRCFCRAGLDSIIICPPTYGMYKVAATIQNATAIEIPLIKQQAFSLDVDAILAAWKPGVKLVFLCSPNNPTGNLLHETDIINLSEKLRDKALIIVDEAYIEFTQTTGMVDYLPNYPNLVILRTLSKAYGLAGIRCGVIMANPEIIKILSKIIAPYPIPKSSALLICKILSASGLVTVKDNIKLILGEKFRLIKNLQQIPSIKHIWPSDTNFLLCEVNAAEIITQQCADFGIAIRDRSSEPMLDNCLRISIGTPLENDLLCEALANG